MLFMKVVENKKATRYEWLFVNAEGVNSNLLLEDLKLLADSFEDVL